MFLLPRGCALTEAIRTSSHSHSQDPNPGPADQLPKERSASHIFRARFSRARATEFRRSSVCPLSLGPQAHRGPRRPPARRPPSRKAVVIRNKSSKKQSIAATHGGFGQFGLVFVDPHGVDLTSVELHQSPAQAELSTPVARWTSGPWASCSLSSWGAQLAATRQKRASTIGCVSQVGPLKVSSVVCMPSGLWMSGP